MRRHRVRQGLAIGIALVASGALASPAAAVLGGKNGRIVIASGRPDAVDDAHARLYLIDMNALPSPVVGAAFAQSATEQHRHPTWSPDRTKVAYARGTPNTFALEDFEIFIQDLV